MKLRIHDIRASVVVFLVALPLCLGIALASNAPLSAGLISGIIGGIVVGFLGGSNVAISGPAAGLTVIVAASVTQLGGYPAFALAVTLSGILQLLMGYVKAGELGNFFPASVIKGMLAAIGILLILKQIPHALGWDSDYMGDVSFGDIEGQNTISDLLSSWRGLHWGATIISCISIPLIVLWDKYLIKKNPRMSVIPSALLVVILGIVCNELILKDLSRLAIGTSHLVQLPYSGFMSFIQGMIFVSFDGLNNFTVWKVALTIAIIGSLETLLSLDASDKIDPLKRISLKNKELRAQGIGNILSGLCGGLPMTAVIIRTSANVESGGLSRVSAVLHGLWLFMAVILIPDFLNRIPLASLASVLIIIGWKLTSIKVIKSQIKMGFSQSFPFIVTILAIVFTDLLVGITVGLSVGLLFVLYYNAQSSIMVINMNGEVLIRFLKDVSFLQKASLRKILRGLKENTSVVIDGSRTIYIDHDIEELIEDFVFVASKRNISVRLQKSPLAISKLFKE